MTVQATATLPREEDVLLCTEVLSPRLQAIIDMGYAGAAFLCGITLLFAELVRAPAGRFRPYSWSWIKHQAGLKPPSFFFIPRIRRP